MQTYWYKNLSNIEVLILRSTDTIKTYLYKNVSYILVLIQKKYWYLEVLVQTGKCHIRAKDIIILIWISSDTKRYWNINIPMQRLMIQMWIRSWKCWYKDVLIQTDSDTNVNWSSAYKEVLIQRDNGRRGT